MEEHIQRTGVAIETQGFSFITSGRKRESLTVTMTSRIISFLLPHVLPSHSRYPSLGLNRKLKVPLQKYYSTDELQRGSSCSTFVEHTP